MTIKNPEPSWIHGGDLIARQLEAFGIEHLFTLTGGHISPIYDGIRFTKIKIVDFRHEQAVVHAADAVARIKRSPAVAAVTAGPGVTGALTGVANAYYSESPVITLGGRNPYMSDGAGNLQEAPHLELMRPVTKYCAGVYDLWRVCEVIHDAFASASTPRTGTAFIDVPVDLQLSRMTPEAAPPIRKRLITRPGFPDPESVRSVAESLASATQPVIIVGTGGYWAGAESALREFGLALKAPIFLNGMARGLLGSDFPFQVLGNRKQALLGADLVLMLGVDFDFRLGFGQAGTFHPEAAIIQVDPDASRVGRNKDISLGIVSDINNFLMALNELDSIFAKKKNPIWTQSLVDNDLERAGRMNKIAGDSSKGVHPEAFVREVSDFLDPGATVIGDGGDIVALFAGRHKPGGPGMWMDPGPFGCLGVGAPFAIGARLCRPSSQIAVIYGDGSFGFNGFEYDSAVRQQLPFVGIMGNDGAWGEMRTFHEDIFGKEDMAAQYLSQKTSYEDIVTGLGGYAERVTRAEDIKPALDRAFNSNLPALVNVILDQDYRKRSGTVSGKQVVLSYGEGDPNAYKRSGKSKR